MCITIIRVLPYNFSFRVWLLLCSIFLFSPVRGVDFELATFDEKQGSHPGTEIEILVAPYVYNHVLEMLEGKPIGEFRNFDHPLSRRDTVDYILLVQALILGGIPYSDIKPKLWHGNSYKRIFKRLQDGEATFFSNTIWREDILGGNFEGLAVSEATIKNGDYIVGMYMNPNNPKFGDRELDLSLLTAVSSRQWNPDWSTIEGLGVKHIFNAVKWVGMVEMVHKMRADFMLMPFTQSSNFAYHAEGMSLLPKPGIKIRIAGSRGWAYSLKSKQGLRAGSALYLGLALLNEDEIISRAYQSANVICSDVEGWVFAADASGKGAINMGLNTKNGSTYYISKK